MASAQITKKNTPLRTVVFGCQQIAIDCIRFLLKQKAEIPFVITYETPLDQTFGYASVQKFCNENNIEVINTPSISQELIDRIIEFNPDFIFSFYFRKLIPKRLIRMFPDNCLNIHPSLLPKYRGPVPTAWAIEKGEKDFGMTIHLIDEGIDTGDILVQKKYAIHPDETGFQLHQRSMKLGTELFSQNYKSIINHQIKRKKQQGSGSYYGKRSARHQVQWNRRVKEIMNIIRVHSKPFHPVESRLLNYCFFINHAKPVLQKNYTPQGPGKIISVTSDLQIVVSCADGCLLLEDYEVAPSLSREQLKKFIRPGLSFE